MRTSFLPPIGDPPIGGTMHTLATMFSSTSFIVVALSQSHLIYPSQRTLVLATNATLLASALHLLPQSQLVQHQGNARNLPMQTHSHRMLKIPPRQASSLLTLKQPLP